MAIKTARRTSPPSGDGKVMVRVINARTDSVDYLMLVTYTPKKLLKHYTRHLEQQGF